jgi:hypothetical protein
LALKEGAILDIQPPGVTAAVFEIAGIPYQGLAVPQDMPGEQRVGSLQEDQIDLVAGEEGIKIGYEIDGNVAPPLGWCNKTAGSRSLEE